MQRELQRAVEAGRGRARRVLVKGPEAAQGGDGRGGGRHAKVWRVIVQVGLKRRWRQRVQSGERGSTERLRLPRYVAESSQRRRGAAAAGTQCERGCASQAGEELAAARARERDAAAVCGESVCGLWRARLACLSKDWEARRGLKPPSPRTIRNPVNGSNQFSRRAFWVLLAFPGTCCVSDCHCAVVRSRARGCVFDLCDKQTLLSPLSLIPEVGAEDRQPGSKRAGGVAQELLASSAHVTGGRGVQGATRKRVHGAAASHQGDAKGSGWSSQTHFCSTVRTSTFRLVTASPR